MRGNRCVGCGDEDCSRQESPEQTTTCDQSPSVSILHRKEFFSSSELERRVREGIYTESQDDRYGDRVPSKKQKAKVAILKSILSLTESQ